MLLYACTISCRAWDPGYEIQREQVLLEVSSWDAKRKGFKYINTQDLGQTLLAIITSTLILRVQTLSQCLHYQYHVNLYHFYFFFSSFWYSFSNSFINYLFLSLGTIVCREVTLGISRSSQPSPVPYKLYSNLRLLMSCNKYVIHTAYIICLVYVKICLKYKGLWRCIVRYVCDILDIVHCFCMQSTTFWGIDLSLISRGKRRERIYCDGSFRKRYG
jgi:hypothetical protein